MFLYFSLLAGTHALEKASDLAGNIIEEAANGNNE